MEVKTKIKATKIEKKCPKCDTGRLRFMGDAKDLSTSPKYKHYCNECGYETFIKNKKYPKIKI
jgi:ribosomal protein S27AE